MKGYLAGKMSGLPDSGKAAFDFWALALREEGHEVFSPSEADEANGTTEDTPENRRKAIMVDLEFIANHAEFLWIITDQWTSSKGVAVELALAQFLGIPHAFLSRG